MHEDCWIRALTKLANNTTPWWKKALTSPKSLGSKKRKKAADYRKLIVKLKGGKKSLVKELKPGGVMTNRLMPLDAKPPQGPPAR